jgi:hypothetical protein
LLLALKRRGQRGAERREREGGREGANLGPTTLVLLLLLLTGLEEVLSRVELQVDL